MRISDWSSDVCSSDLTGPSEHLKALAKGADYLICEVIDLARVERLVRAFPGFTPDQLPSLMQHLVADHLTGEQIGEIAAEAEVKKVILTHFSPGSAGETNIDSYRSEEHTSEIQSLMRISYAVFCLKTKNSLNTNMQITKIIH